MIIFFFRLIFKFQKKTIPKKKLDTCVEEFTFSIATRDVGRDSCTSQMPAANHQLSLRHHRRLSWHGVCQVRRLITETALIKYVCVCCRYHNVDDAFAVFDDLNGLDIMGRALRVEYKRYTTAACSFVD